MQHVIIATMACYGRHWQKSPAIGRRKTEDGTCTARNRGPSTQFISAAKRQRCNFASTTQTKTQIPMSAPAKRRQPDLPNIANSTGDPQPHKSENDLIVLHPMMIPTWRAEQHLAPVRKETKMLFLSAMQPACLKAKFVRGVGGGVGDFCRVCARLPTSQTKLVWFWGQRRLQPGLPGEREGVMERGNEATDRFSCQDEDRHFPI